MPPEDELKLTQIRLAKGDFRRVTWGGTQVERFYVLARRGASGDVVVWSADHPELCSLGPQPWYRGVFPLHSGTLAIGSPSPGRVLYAEEVDEDGVGSLRFASLDCEPTETVTPPVRLADLRSVYPTDFLSAGYVALTPERELLHVDPWRMEQRRLATGVERFAAVEHAIWLLEQGRVVLRDLEGRALLQIGHDVRSFIVLGARTLAYIETDPESGRNGLWLSRTAEDGSEQPLALAGDVCSVRPVAAAEATLGYFSPCAEHTLTVRGLDADAEPQVIATGVLEWQSDRGVVFYAASDDASLDGESPIWLWAAPLDDAEREPQQLRRFDVFSIEQVWALSRSTFALVARNFQDPEHQTLQLWRVDLASASEKVKPLESDLESLRVGADEIATVHRDGTLKVFSQRDLHQTFTTERVLPGSTRFVFGSEDPALAFLADPVDLDPAEDEEDWVGRLELRFGSTGERLPPIAEYVREFQEVWWPERGLLYTVARGPEIGIHFVAVDIPCEQATGSQWACGF